jgi:hypothetical protein
MSTPTEDRSSTQTPYRDLRKKSASKWLKEACNPSNLTGNITIKSNKSHFLYNEKVISPFRQFEIMILLKLLQVAWEDTSLSPICNKGLYSDVLQ